MVSIRHNCGKEKDLELSWVDPTGNTADRIKCNICGREFIDTIFIKKLKDKLGVKAIGSKYAEEVIDKLVGDKSVA